MPIAKSTPIAKVIKDFQNSNNPRFRGKPKKKRREQAIAAYYSKQNEEFNFEEIRDRYISEGIQNIKDRIRDIEVQTTYPTSATTSQVNRVDNGEKLKEIGDRAYSIYRSDIKPKEAKPKIEEKPSTIASRADISARMRELTKTRNGGDYGKVSPTGTNGSGNVSNCDQGINVGLYPTSLTIEEYEDYINEIFENTITMVDEEEDYYIPLHESKKEETEVESPIADVIENLEEELLELKDKSWQSIDTLMRSICREHNITPKQLHNEFKKTHGMIPDEWIKQQEVNEVCGWFPLDEATRINKVGMVYDVTLIFRGQSHRVKFFWPNFKRPTKSQMQQAVEKLYPTGRLLAYYPCMEQQNNTMVIVTPMNEYYSPIQEDEWGQMSEESTMIYEEICTEEGEPVTPPYLVEDGIYEVVVDDYDTGEEKAIRFEEIGEPGSGKHYFSENIRSTIVPSPRKVNDGAKLALAKFNHTHGEPNPKDKLGTPKKKPNPNIVPSPRRVNDAARIALARWTSQNESYETHAPLKSAKTPEQIAKKHGVSVEKIRQQLALGIQVEKEHTTDKGPNDERHIALQHLDELPDYYSKLKKVEKTK